MNESKAGADVFRAPIGTHDVLAPASNRWIELVSRFAGLAARYGFGLAITPLFEHREVFARVGETTDVVRKEMYDFEDKGGRALALRPEGTAPIVRAYVQHRPTPPWKAWYLAPNFRYERPQKGRYRQHYQLGAEVLGIDDPEIDVEIIALAHAFYRELGLTGVRLLLNSMGDEHSRPRYHGALRAYLLDHCAELGEEFAARVEANPLRILDSKNPDWRAVTEGAPVITDFLSDESAAHLASVQAGLAELGIDYEPAPRLVRGFDYYTRTVFEFAADALDAAQNAIGGGGRYDRLAEEMHGPPTPGIGFGIGIERVLLACDAEEVLAPPTATVDAFVIDALEPDAPVGMSSALVLAALRSRGIAADRAYGGRSVKAQWKVADRSGARFGVMLGTAEAERGAVGVKDLRNGRQVEVRQEDVVSWIATRLEEQRP